VIRPPIQVRPWGLSPAQEAEVLRSLRFRHFKWDTFVSGAQTILPETMVVDEALHRQVVATVEALHQALLRFEARVVGNPRALEQLGIPRPLHPLLLRERDHGLHCARYDLFPTEDGRLMVSEFNEDVPGGFNEAQGIPDLLGDPGPGLRWEAGIRTAFQAAFRPYDGVALLYATGFAEDLQHMLILERWLREAGHPTILGSPAHLEKGWWGLRVLGTRVEAAFRFFPGEWMPNLPNFATWAKMGPSLPMMNPLRRLISQSKMMFALWQEDDTLDPADRALVDRHCPRTLRFDPSLVPRLMDKREDWVLKRAFGRMGDAVVMGNLATPREWDAALREAARQPGEWCAQERFQVAPLLFSGGPLFPTLGAFLLNGRFAGYYSRAAPKPFLTHEALYVGTLVQTS
jgi:glutathionylspermidine synthase